jgi:hypothetical protein
MLWSGDKIKIITTYEYMDLSPTLMQSMSFNETNPDEETTAILQSPESPTLLHLLMSSAFIWWQPSTREEIPTSAILLHPEAPRSSNCKQLFDRTSNKSSVINLQPVMCSSLNFWHICAWYPIVIYPIASKLCYQSIIMITNSRCTIESTNKTKIGLFS